MARAERIFRYPELMTFRTKDFAPRHMTREQREAILNHCLEKSGKLIVYTQQACAFFNQEVFIKAQQLSPADRVKFILYTSDVMMLGERFTVITPTHRFSGN